MLEWAWQHSEINLRCVNVSSCLLYACFNIIAFKVPEIKTFILTDGHDQINSDIDTDNKYIFLIGSETPPSNWYILFKDLCSAAVGVSGVALVGPTFSSAK